MRDLAAWLEIQAQEFENGDARHFHLGADDSAEAAATYRHRLRNIVAVVQAYNRLTAKEETREEPIRISVRSHG